MNAGGYDKLVASRNMTRDAYRTVEEILFEDKKKEGRIALR
jgi:hypothetical protein